MTSQTYIEPKLPDGLFVLAHDPEMDREGLIESQMFDGPYDGNDTARDADGTTVLLSEGLPYPLPVLGQDGDVLTLQGGKMRLHTWPLIS